MVKNFTKILLLQLSLLSCSSEDALEPELTNDEFEVTAPLSRHYDIIANDRIPSGVSVSFVETQVSDDFPGVAYFDYANQQLYVELFSELQQTVSLTYTVSFDRFSSSKNALVVLKPTQETELVATDDSLTVLMNEAILLDPLLNDAYSENTALKLKIIDRPKMGYVYLSQENKIKYEPKAQFTGNDSFSYKLTSGKKESNIATVTVSVVESINNPPSAEDDEFNISNDSSQLFDVLINDTDEDNNELMLQAALDTTNLPGIATVENNKIRVEIENDFIGVTFFKYQVSDGVNISDWATVTLNVSSSNSDPIANNDIFSIYEGEAVLLDALQNDTDADGDSLTLIGVQVKAGGTADIKNNTIAFSSAKGFIGNAELSYSIADGKGGAASANIIVEVNENSAPLAVNDFINLQQDGAIEFNPLNNDSDPDGHDISLKSVQSESGEIQVTFDQNVLNVESTGTPEGEYKVNYLVEDTAGAESRATVTVRVYPATEQISQLSWSELKDGRYDEFSAFIPSLKLGSSDRFRDVFSISDETGDSNELLFTFTGFKNGLNYHSVMFSLKDTANSDGILKSPLDLWSLVDGKTTNNQAQAYLIEHGMPIYADHGRADLNNDGTLDNLFVVSDEMNVYFGDGSEEPIRDIADQTIEFPANGLGVATVDAYDVNEDGIDDLIVIPNVVPGNAQELKVFFGPINNTDVNILSSDITENTGLVITGFSQSGSNSLGLSYHFSDLNGDGHTELIVGDLGASSNTGEVYIFWDKGALSAQVDIQDLENNSDISSTVIRVGDLVDVGIGKVIDSSDTDADGRAELILGLIDTSTVVSEIQMGEVNLISGDVWPKIVELSDMPNALSYERIYVSNGFFKEHLNRITQLDINGDGYTDLVFNYLDTVKILLGGSQTRSQVYELKSLSWPALTIEVPIIIHKLLPVNLNNDAFDDLVVVRKEGSNFEASILYGGYQYNFTH